MDKVGSIHYFPLPSQGNIYCLTKLCLSNGVNKVLVATLRRKIYSFEFHSNDTGILKPILREVQFTYIPDSVMNEIDRYRLKRRVLSLSYGTAYLIGIFRARKAHVFTTRSFYLLAKRRLYYPHSEGGAEIISIDAFSKSTSADDFVIGITIIKCGEHTVEAYLNIYSEWESNSEFNLESVAQNCLNLELNFVPHQLFHTELSTGVLSETNTEINKEIVWLLSGSDKKIHLFREDRDNHCYSEVDTLEFFPEFSEAPSIILWMDVYYTSDHERRISAYACECGYLQVSVVDVQTKKIVENWCGYRNFLISTIRLFPDSTIMKCPSFVDLPDERDSSLPVSKMNLLVTDTFKSCVYMDIMGNGLKKCYKLPHSDKFDAVLCSLIADVDFDGKPEILLGTFSQELLMYKYIDNDDKKCGEWQLQHQRSFAHPIHSMLHLDITGDGVREYIILTQKGVDILQHDPDDIMEKFESKIKSIKLKMS